MKDIELPPFVLIFVYLEQNICQEKVKGVPFNNCLIFKLFLRFLKTYQLAKAPLGVMTICRNLGIIVKPSEEVSVTNNREDRARRIFINLIVSC
jgi:hypothetical protein